MAHTTKTKKEKRRVKYAREKAARAAVATSTSTPQSQDGTSQTKNKGGRPPKTWVPPLKRKKLEEEENQAVSKAAKRRLRSATTNNDDVEEDMLSPQLRSSTRSMSSSKTISPEENAKTPAIHLTICKLGSRLVCNPRFPSNRDAFLSLLSSCTSSIEEIC